MTVTVESFPRNFALNYNVYVHIGLTATDFMQLPCKCCMKIQLDKVIQNIGWRNKVCVIKKGFI